MTDLITTDLVRLGAAWGSDKHDVIRALAGVVEDAGRATSKDQLIEDAFARESTSATGLPGGIAIPHCRTAGRRDPDARLRAARPARRLRRQGRPGRPGVPDRGTRRRRRRPPHHPDQAGPRAGQAGLHRRAARGGDRRGGRRPGHARDRRARSRRRSAAAAAAAPAAGCRCRRCPAARPTSAASRRSSRSPPARPASPTPTWPPRPSRPRPSAPVSSSTSRPRVPRAPPRWPRETISQAGAVIFAVDVGVRDRSRFAGKPMVSSGVKRPIDDADAMIAEALRYAADPASAPKVEGTAERGRQPSSMGQETWGGRTRRVLMTGVSYMIPFVAAGGLLIALSFLLGGYEIVGPYGDIAVNNTLFSPPDVDRARPRPRALRLRGAGLHRRHLLHHRQDGVHVLRARRSPATSPTPSPTDPASRPASSWVAWPSTSSTCRAAATTRSGWPRPASSAPSSAASSPA